MLSIPSDGILTETICELEPGLLGWIRNDSNLCNRIKIESIYTHAAAEQSKEVEEVRRDEQLMIPRTMDYFA